MLQTASLHHTDSEFKPANADQQERGAADDGGIVPEPVSRVQTKQTPRSKAGAEAVGRTVDRKAIFFIGLLLTATGLVSPPVALAGGLVYGFSVEHPFRREASSLAKMLLQLSVILLGFGMDISQVLHVGRAGFVYTATSITFAIAAGLLLGNVLNIGAKASYLITMGTAICGGSAIAALAPITEANDEEISISMGTVFLLNAAALLLFPVVGWRLHLSQDQFGLWAALAIHDTSSVVGAAAKYGDQSLAIGTTVKLARALWIVPISLLTAVVMHRTTPTVNATRTRVKMPWFIVLFLLASIASTYLLHFASTFRELNYLGRLGLTATLFLIGTGLSRKTVREVGVRPFLQGLILWMLIGCISLAAIYYHLTSI